MISEELLIYGKPNLKSLENIASKLENAINSFSSLMEMAVTYYDENNNTKWCSRSKEPICTGFDIFKDKNGTCRRNLASAAAIASDYSEPYIFLCRSGLVNIAFSLFIQGESCGCFIAGPLIMGELKPSVYSNMLSLNSMDNDTYSKAILEVNKLRIYTPKEVDNIAVLLRNCILGSLADNDDYLAKHRNYENTISINGKLQKSKHIEESLAYPHDLENELTECIKAGDTSNSLEIMNELLNKISIIEAAEPDPVKVAVIGIFSSVSKTAYSDSVLSTEQMDDCFDDIEKINHTSSFSQITKLASALVKKISGQYKKRHYTGDSILVRETISIVYEQYDQKITLSQISKKLHTNPSYLSTLFKKETGFNFTDFLNNYRIEKSIGLLIGTSMSFSHIAENSGFDDQGYYSKVFKKNTGLSPRDYRKKHLHSGNV